MLPVCTPSMVMLMVLFGRPLMPAARGPPPDPYCTPGSMFSGVERVARAQRHFVQLLGDERRRHGGDWRLHQLGARADLHGLVQRAKLEDGLDACRSARDDPDVAEDRGLEALQRNGDGVGPDGDAGDREHARLIRNEFEGLRRSRCSSRPPWRQESRRRRSRRRRRRATDCCPARSRSEYDTKTTATARSSRRALLFMHPLPLHELQAYKRR